MKVKNFFVAGIIASAMFLTGTTVGFAAGDKELCSKQKVNFLKIKMNNGLLPNDEFAPYNFKEVAGAAKEMIAVEGQRTHNDKTHAAISKLVTVHLAHIQEAAQGEAEGAVEVAGHALRFLELSCKACHKVYDTERKNKKMSP
ncbi:MAG: hypothetical protein NUV86_10050 [Candidatus Scalindua sp.]|nr:hypothetical protein [Candidatus Scalindua sp.]MCR4344435.1 hypothetical protein [Candidatus Scalindua sp.]